jgi:hypothetical protein
MLPGVYSNYNSMVAFRGIQTRPIGTGIPPSAWVNFRSSGQFCEEALIRADAVREACAAWEAGRGVPCGRAAADALARGIVRAERLRQLGLRPG